MRECLVQCLGQHWACCVGRGGAVGGDASAVTCGGRPAAQSPRRGEELGGKSTPEGWTANGGDWAQDCGVAVDLERLLLLLRCLRRRQLKRGYLRMREASGDARVDGPRRAVRERERGKGLKCWGGLGASVRARALARRSAGRCGRARAYRLPGKTRCGADAMQCEAMRCSAVRCDAMRCDAK